MSELGVRMVALSTGDLDESIRFYTETIVRDSEKRAPASRAWTVPPQAPR